MAFPASPVAAAGAAGTNGATTGAINTSGCNLLINSVAYYDGVTLTPTVSDSKFNTWVALTKRVVANVAQQLYYSAGTPSVGSGHTFSATGSSIFASTSVQAWSGADASPFDQQNGATNMVSASIQPGSVTPTANGELVVTGHTWSQNFGGTVTVGGGFTISTSMAFTGGVNEGGALAYLIQTTAAAANPTWSDTITAAERAAAIATFKAAAGGGAPTLSLTATDAVDSLSSAVLASIAATLSRSDAADTLNSTALVSVATSLNRSDAVDTVSSTVTVAVAATFSVVDAADTLNAAVANGGVGLTATDAADTLGGAAAVSVAATLSTGDATDTLTAVATVSVSTSLAKTDDTDTLTSLVLTGAGIVVNFDVIDDADTLQALVDAGGQPIVIGGGGGYAHFDYQAPAQRDSVQAVNDQIVRLTTLLVAALDEEGELECL